MRLQFESVVATGSTALDSGIGDTALKTFNGTTYLYTVTGPGGGVAVWRLIDGAIPQLVDTEYYSGSITFLVGRSGTPVDFSGTSQLVLDVNTATGLVGYDLNSNGTIRALQETDTLSGGGNIGAVVQFSLGSSELVVLSHGDTSQIGTYHVSSDGSLNLAGLIAGEADSMQAVRSGSGQFLIASDAVNDRIATYQIDDSTGLLTEIDNGSTLGTLGVATPTAVETVEAYGKSWVVVAGSGSNSLSVLQVNQDGSLKATNHVLDTLDTRFESVQDLAVAEVNGRVFVVAGGGDDGVSLFNLTPQGQLVYLDSFADTLASGLQNVESLSVAHVGEDLQILVTSQQEAGVTVLTVPVDELGTIRTGFATVTGTASDDMLSGSILDTTLIGGGGDDILIAGAGATTMSGGAGADIFVMQSGSGVTTISDFQPGMDRLDMFDYLLLRSPQQLNFTSTSQGARIEYRGEVVEVKSAFGGPLSSAEIFGAGFAGPDHIPVDFGNFGGLTPNSSDGLAGLVTIDSETANPGLTDAEIRFTPDGGGTVSTTADAQGNFDLELPDGTYSGSLDVIKYYSTASNEIDALDALQVLRIAVGLDPTWGPATAEDLIAADVNQNGTVNALDALEILQVVVGQPSAPDLQWVFLDENSDLSGITKDNVTYDTGTNVTAVDGVIDVDMTSILLGNLEAA
ncbi:MULTISPECIES: beta-propeller fold lactonase family protein [unclassified Ruegeria]|uniref:beta-propeller fold lactonase family protein n=1 Tax=unclassified Ruegeria TaxID=2625375 RepID=UPI00149241DB|nr:MULTISPECIES: beta-propeller fold lactonase family protein [unclassified Ruegeria]NOD47550.1 beta-propeller fold lactonase family protein [Ruegeria sp. HKCCD5849]NOD52787.1 beta-propeller fold lactonase family protein [Ruegeria sp. HKCCD5851]NOD66206.1 beta-propeller fold lactonase family protein [Ruegeria sp. HKCCD7303]